jgi:phosphoglycolate phosphatase
VTHPEPRTLIFDWDNTLVDTWEAIHHALSTTFQAMDMQPWTLEETRERVRRSAREAFPEIFGERSDAATTIFYETFARDHLDLLRPAPGAAEMLQALASAGYDLAIVSNKTGGYLRLEAEQLGWDRHFRRIVGATDAARDKPAPEAVLLALTGSPVSPRGGPEVWFIGDTDIDLACAHNSGCYPVLLRAQPPLPGEFGSAPPALHLDSCRALSELLIKSH